MKKMPLSDARAAFHLRPSDGGTEVTFRYRYTPSRVGRILGGVLEKMLAKGLDGLMTGLQQECESR